MWLSLHPHQPYEERVALAFRKEELITASEVARYVYCQRAWAYDKRGVRVRRRGLGRLLPSGRLAWMLLIGGLILIVGVFVVAQIMGNGS